MGSLIAGGSSGRSLIALSKGIMRGTPKQDYQFLPIVNPEAAEIKKPRSGDCRLNRAVLAGILRPIMTQKLRFRTLLRGPEAVNRKSRLLRGFLHDIFLHDIIAR